MLPFSGQLFFDLNLLLICSSRRQRCTLLSSVWGTLHALHPCYGECRESAISQAAYLFDDSSFPVPEDRYREYQKKDQESYGGILKISGNRVILDFIRKIEFILRCYQKSLNRNPDETLMEHKEIIDTIRNSKVDKAQKLIMPQHWKTGEKLRTMPDPEV